jgi:hypothetical protein
VTSTSVDGAEKVGGEISFVVSAVVVSVDAAEVEGILMYCLDAHEMLESDKRLSGCGSLLLGSCEPDLCIFWE